MSNFVRDLVLFDGSITPAFVPTSISGLQLWLDASDATTITLDGSNNVEQWRDKASTNHAAQASTLLRPDMSTVNSLGAVQFDAVDDLLTGTEIFTANNPFTMFAVVRRDGATTTERVAYFIAGTDEFFGLSIGSNGAASGRPGYLNGGVAWRPEGGSDLYNGDVVLQQLSRTPNATSYLRYPGAVSQSNTDTPTATPYGVYRIGWQGGAGIARQATTVCEIIVYDSDLSAGNKTSVRAYLGAKWGVTV